MKLVVAAVVSLVLFISCTTPARVDHRRDKAQIVVAPSASSLHRESVSPSDPQGLADELAWILINITANGHRDFVDHVLWDAKQRTGCLIDATIGAFPDSLRGEERHMRREVLPFWKRQFPNVAVEHLPMTHGELYPGVGDATFVGVIIGVDCRRRIR